MHVWSEQWEWKKVKMDKEEAEDRLISGAIVAKDQVKFFIYSVEK